MTRRVGLTVVVALALAVAACGGDGNGADRGEVLDALSTDGIVPSYQQLADDLDALAAATTALCAAPSAAKLTDVQAALATARASWKLTEPMWVGPVMGRRSWAVIDWPIRTDEIEDLIADGEAELTVEQLGTGIGADQRGLGAIEYVVGNDASSLAALDDPRRCDYLTGVAEVAAAEGRLLPSDWTKSFEDGDPYQATFANPDDDGLDMVVNDALNLLERMTDRELGAALRVRDGEPDPDAIIEGPAGLGVDDMQARLRGLQLVLIGEDDESGLAPLLGSDLTDRLRGQINDAEAALDAIDGPLRAATTSSPESVAAARDVLKKLQVTLNTEVVSKLGVTVGFSDADGDSAG